MGEGVAEEARDAHGDVDARAAELGQRDHLDPGDPCVLRVPDRAHAEQGQDLGHVVALGPHRRRAPGDEPDHAGQLAGVALVALEQRVGQAPADVPGQLGRQRARVDGVEVAPGRQHVDATARGAARRPRGHVAAVQRGDDGGDLVGRALDARHDLGGGEAQRALDAVVLRAEHGRQPRRRPPSPAPRARPAAPPAPPRAGRPRRRCWPPDPGSARAAPPAPPAQAAPGAATSAGSSSPYAAPTARRSPGTSPRPQPQHGADQPAQLLALGRAAEHVQPVLDLDVLDLAQVAVDVADEGAEVVGPLGHAELGLQVRALDGRPDARRQRRQLGRVEHLEPGVVVQQRLELGQLVVGLGSHHRRHQVVDDRRVGAPLGLHALAGVVDHERVDERDVAQRRVGRAPGREREHLARQPLERPVLAQVDERVGAPHAVQPPVAREVVVGGRKLGVVVDPHRVVAVAARRLDGQDHVAQRQPRDHEVVAVHVLVARRRAPALLHRRAQRLRQLRVPGPVLRRPAAAAAPARAARR